MHTRMMQWSRGLYLAGIVLALVLVVPIAWFPFQLTKIAVFSLCLAASAVLFVAAGGARELLRMHGLKIALLGALLPLAYAVSLYFSTDGSVGVSGFSIETDTLVFATLAFGAFFMGFVHFRTLRTAQIFLTTITVALGAAALLQMAAILFGSGIPFGADPSSNVVGKWNDLGLLAGLFAVLLFAHLQFGESSKRVRMLLAALLVPIAVLLAFVNFILAWVLVLLGALGVALVAFLAERNAARERSVQQVQGAARSAVPVLPLVFAAVALAGVLWGAAFNTQLSSIIPVSSLEVRPGYSTTIDVIHQAHDSSIAKRLVGTGPNTFGQEWLMYKPLEVNQSQFWSLDFNVGYSTVVTAFGTTGLLGVLGWLIPSLLVLMAALRVVRLRVLTDTDRSTAIALVCASLFLAIAAVWYVPSGNLLILMMGVCGVAFGFLWRQGRSTNDEHPSRLGYLAALVLVVVVAGLSVWDAAASLRRLSSEAFAGRGATELSSGNIDAARAHAATALRMEETGNTLRFAATAGAAKLAALAQDTSSPQADLQQQFSSILQEVLSAAARAEARNPRDYRPTLILAQVYDFLSQLRVDGALAQARVAYDSAAAKNPTNPQIPLMRARLEALAEDTEALQKHLGQALTLKSNYTDAMLFMTQLAIANNDLPTAVQSAQAAVQSAPGVPSLWFQLGLLLYSGGDTTNAVPILEQALTLQPDYANARYFLGLSYYAQDRAEEAIRQFEELARTNPDNSEVALVLTNMRDGKEPFLGAEPPADTPPEDRSTAPVNQ